MDGRAGSWRHTPTNKSVHSWVCTGRWRDCVYKRTQRGRRGGVCVCMCVLYMSDCISGFASLAFCACSLMWAYMCSADITVPGPISFKAAVTAAAFVCVRVCANLFFFFPLATAEEVKLSTSFSSFSGEHNAVHPNGNAESGSFHRHDFSQRNSKNRSQGSNCGHRQSFIGCFKSRLNILFWCTL